MKQNLIADYLSCFLFRAVSLFSFFLPLNLSLFFGRRLGDLIYLCDQKHRAIVYGNVRRTVADKLDGGSAARITRQTYQAFGQNLVEISFIPRINKRYLQKYIHIENQDYAQEAFKRGKGVIFLIVHEGNWELSNIICANLGVPFVLFVRDQGFPRLNALLNSYRLKQGAKVIHKNAGLRELIEVLKDNQSIGMTVDQGGKKGELVEFFGRDASMSTGAVKLALRHDCAIIPIYYRRIKGPHTQLILDQVFTVKRCGDPQADLRQNLQRLIGIYEQYLRRYPHEYLWTYKIYKYSRQKELLIISDGKVGHLRQSEGAAKLIGQALRERKISTRLFSVEIKFRSPLSGFILNLLAKFSGRYQGNGYGMRYLRYALTPQSWQELMRYNPDMVISAGGSTSAVNYLLSRESQAKSVVLMRPGFLSLKKFNLAIIPRHDLTARAWLGWLNKNLVVTEGALNLVDAQYLQEKVKGLKQSGLLKEGAAKFCIGVLIGGDSRKFKLDPAAISKLAQEIKKSASRLDADILISTSRRSSPAVEAVIRNEFADYARCRLLVIANQQNHPDAVGGILGLSHLVISSPESISMISEAASAGKYTVVFSCANLSIKHGRFLENYRQKGYIYLEETDALSTRVEQLLQDQPEIKFPQDNLKVIAGINKIL